jgi:hypothetical protein
MLRAFNTMGGVSKLEQLCMLKDTKTVSWLKPLLEIEINYGQCLILNAVMLLRSWNAKIWSSNTLNSLDSISSFVLFIFIDRFPLMKTYRT